MSRSDDASLRHCQEEFPTSQARQIEDAEGVDLKEDEGSLFMNLVTDTKNAESVWEASFNKSRGRTRVFTAVIAFVQGAFVYLVPQFTGQLQECRLAHVLLCTTQNQYLAACNKIHSYTTMRCFSRRVKGTTLGGFDSLWRIGLADLDGLI